MAEDNLRLATTDNLGEVQLAGYAKHYSTAAEYREAGAGAQNPAGANIDAGREPYLVNLDAVELGVHPFVTVYDADIKLNGELVGISTAKNTYWLRPNTLIAWR